MGIDWTDVGRLASNRSRWKKLVNKGEGEVSMGEQTVGAGLRVWGGEGSWGRRGGADGVGLEGGTSVGAWVGGLVASIVGGW